VYLKMRERRSVPFQRGLFNAATHEGMKYAKKTNIARLYARYYY